MTTAQEKEFTVFGIAKTMRSGIMIGFLSISLLLNAFLLKRLLDKYDLDDRAKQEVVNEVLKKSLKSLEPTKDSINRTVEKVSTVADKAGAAAATVDSISQKLEQKFIKKP